MIGRNVGQDDHLLLPTPPPPEAVELRPHRFTVRLALAAVGLSLAASGAAIYQGCEARNARRAADRSATAAEKSAKEAEALNKLTVTSLEIARASASASERSAKAAADQVALMGVGNEQARQAHRLNIESIRGRVTAI